MVSPLNFKNDNLEHLNTLRSHFETVSLIDRLSTLHYLFSQLESASSDEERSAILYVLFSLQLPEVFYPESYSLMELFESEFNLTPSIRENLLRHLNFEIENTHLVSGPYVTSSEDHQYLLSNIGKSRRLRELLYLLARHMVNRIHLTKVASYVPLAIYLKKENLSLEAAIEKYRTDQIFTKVKKYYQFHFSGFDRYPIQLKQLLVENRDTINRGDWLFLGGGPGITAVEASRFMGYDGGILSIDRSESLKQIFGKTYFNKFENGVHKRADTAITYSQFESELTKINPAWRKSLSLIKGDFTSPFKLGRFSFINAEYSLLPYCEGENLINGLKNCLSNLAENGILLIRGTSGTDFKSVVGLILQRRQEKLKVLSVYLGNSKYTLPAYQLLPYEQFKSLSVDTPICMTFGQPYMLK